MQTDHICNGALHAEGIRLTGGALPGCAKGNGLPENPVEFMDDIQTFGYGVNDV
jgi:hypothetical protein